MTTQPLGPAAAFLCQGEHKKAYSGVVYLTFPVQYPWVCVGCGEHGTDYGDPARGGW